MMLSKGIYSFLDQNLEMAKELRYDDDKVDDLFDQTLEHVTISMFKDKEAINYLVNLLFIARFLERVADRAVSIADRTIFMITCEKP
ncbi:MAG: phosphate uptake regulator PhoU, partial [Methanobacteriaceae archaeon]|nr:phosphate uptake regulator PhoU [Methanobacteriaceae archaeon]